ncbi:MAG: hypothetical protein P9M11_10925 [Candidatus Tenebribacter burtonii]|nr:hypothetical protein [Candidatus Tenebribacter burtonii]
MRKRNEQISCIPFTKRNLKIDHVNCSDRSSIYLETDSNVKSHNLN